VSGQDRAILVALLLGALGAAIGLAIGVSSLCPAPAPGDPCPDATRNQALVIGAGGVVVALTVTALAFGAEYAARRRIAFRGAWGRAARRGCLVGLAMAALAGLRVVDALNLFSAGVVLGVAAAAEWVAIRRLDAT